MAWDEEMKKEMEERSELVAPRVDWNYSREGFLEHFRECDEAQSLWSESKGGTIPFREPEVATKGGYFKERYHEL